MAPRFYAAAIALAMAVQLALAFRININWDEFLFLSRLYDFVRGDPLGRFQSLHVHLFAWLPAIGGNEVDRIVVGRLVMAACLGGSAALIYAIGRRFAGREASLFGVAAFLSFTAVIQHGASFRADPLATLLVLLAVWLLLAVPRRYAGAALAGVAMAVALLVTVKSVFYLAAIGAAILCLDPAWRDRFRRALAFALPFVAGAGILYVLHVSSLTPAPAPMGEGAGAAPPNAIDAIWNFARRVAGKMFVEEGVFPRWREFLVLLALNPLFWAMAIDGALTSARRGGRNGWLALALALPILSPIVYRNAFLYFFVFVLPPAAILVAIAYDKHRQRLREGAGRGQRLLAGGVVVALLAFAAIGYGRLLPDRLAPQRDTLAGVHEIFPEPVTYIDGFGVIASFPRAGFFMSSWGMDSYRARGEPVFARLVAEAQPPLLLADSPSLHAALVPGFAVPEERLLLPEDARFLSDHYQQYWGMLFVAGKRFALPAGGAGGDFTLAVAGGYRLEAPRPVRIDGRELMPGEVIRLSAGLHRYEAAAAAGADDGEARLLWAAAGPAPSTPPVDLLTFFAIEPAAPAQ